jgi:hypothetical protein
MSDRINRILSQARDETFHEGNRYALYYSYRQEVLRVARSVWERDETLKILRQIFQMEKSK